MEDLISENLNGFEGLYKKSLDSNEVSEMKNNLMNFFKLLIEIDKKNLMKERISNEPKRTALVN